VDEPVKALQLVVAQGGAGDDGRLHLEPAGGRRVGGGGWVGVGWGEEERGRPGVERVDAEGECA